MKADAHRLASGLFQPVVHSQSPAHPSAQSGMKSRGVGWWRAGGDAQQGRTHRKGGFQRGQTLNKDLLQNSHESPELWSDYQELGCPWNKAPSLQRVVAAGRTSCIYSSLESLTTELQQQM